MSQHTVDFDTAPMPGPSQVGERVHVLIWRQGMSQKKVGTMMSLDPTQLGRKMRGVRPWYLQEVVTLARILHTTVAYLVGETDDPTLPRKDSNLQPSGLQLPQVRPGGTAKILRFPVRVGQSAGPRPRPTGNHPVLASRFTA